MVYLGCNRMVCIVDLGDGNCECVVQLQVFFSPWSSFLLLFLLCFLPVSIPVFFLPTGIFSFQVWGTLRTDGALWVPVYTILLIAHLGNDLLFWDELPRTIGWGIAACFGGALSALGLSSILRKAGIGISFPFGGIGHDLGHKKFVEARMVLGHGVSSLVSGMQMWQWPKALSYKCVGCCSIRELLRLGINGTSSPWGFCVEELGTSWIFALGTVYTVNGIVVSLAVGHFEDVAVDFITEVCMAVAVVVIASGFVVCDKGFSISLTFNCILMGILLLFFCFLSMAFLGIGVFHSQVGLTAWLELEYSWLASRPFNSK